MKYLQLLGAGMASRPECTWPCLVGLRLLASDCPSAPRAGTRAGLSFIGGPHALVSLVHEHEQDSLLMVALMLCCPSCRYLSCANGDESSERFIELADKVVVDEQQVG